MKRRKMGETLIEVKSNQWLLTSQNGDQEEEEENGFELKKWTTSSWRQFPIKHQPNYRDPQILESALQQVSFVLISCNFGDDFEN